MDVITAILQIDNKASERIKQANERKDQILLDTEAEKARILADLDRKAADELEKLEQQQKHTSEIKHSELISAENREIARLDRCFEENHRQWEDNAFSAITGK